MSASESERLGGLRLRRGFVAWARTGRVNDLRRHVSALFEAFASTLPDPSTTPEVLVKPNCNNDLHWLTGNSTNLALIAAVVDELRDRGYRHITVGDGSNVGIHRIGADVFGRLGLASLASVLDTPLVDLNRQPARVVPLGRWRVRVAAPVLDADLIVNLPKLKTHQEVGLSLAAKNCMGAVIGLEKKIVHESLVANLVRLADRIRPHLSILDGTIAMEGNGPGDGRPRHIGLLAASDDVFALDAVVGRLAGFDHDSELPLTTEAVRQGMLDGDDLARIRREVEPIVRLDPAPKRTRLSALVGHNRLVPLRDATRWLLYRRPVLDLCYRLKLIQDIYEAEEAEALRYRLDLAACTRCDRCEAVCPRGLPILSSGFSFRPEEGCIRCKSCALVCPTGAIALEGRLGYLQAHLTRYGDLLRRLDLPVGDDSPTRGLDE